MFEAIVLTTLIVLDIGAVVFMVDRIQRLIEAWKRRRIWRMSEPIQLIILVASVLGLCFAVYLIFRRRNHE
jgi:hypothetical protein